MNAASIKDIVRSNVQAGREPYHGLTSEQVATYNRALMFGDDDAGFPAQDEWSRVVD